VKYEIAGSVLDRQIKVLEARKQKLKKRKREKIRGSAAVQA